MPGLKVSCLRWTDAEQDPQHLHIVHSLCERWIETGPTLFDEGKVKCCRVGNRLNVVVGG